MSCSPLAMLCFLGSFVSAIMSPFLVSKKELINSEASNGARKREPIIVTRESAASYLIG